MRQGQTIALAAAALCTAFLLAVPAAAETGEASPTGEASAVAPANPAEPAWEMTPITPLDPLQPMEPMSEMPPMEPVQPIEPVKPMEPASPIEPIEPVQPITPLKPNDPASENEGASQRPPNSEAAPNSEQEGAVVVESGIGAASGLPVLPQGGGTEDGESSASSAAGVQMDGSPAQIAVIVVGFLALFFGALIAMNPELRRRLAELRRPEKEQPGRSPVKSEKRAGGRGEPPDQ